jgi:hypothetical protein
MDTPTPTPTPPIEAPQPQAQAPTPVATPTPIPQSGGSLTDIFKEMNWIEVGFGILGTATLYYAIYYYRYNINQNKFLIEKLQNQIDDSNMKIADMESALIEKESQQRQQVSFF